MENGKAKPLNEISAGKTIPGGGKWVPGRRKQLTKLPICGYNNPDIPKSKEKESRQPSCGAESLGS